MPEKVYYKIDEFIQEYNGERSVIIFGTGDFGQFIFDKLRATKIRVAGFTCNSNSRFGSKYCGIQVCSPELAAKEDAFIIIAIIDAYSKRDVLYQLLALGVSRDRIVIPIEPVGGLFSDSRLKEIPEFAEIEKRVTLEYLQEEQTYFREYFLTNDLIRLAMPVKDEFSAVAERLLLDTGVEICYIDPEAPLDCFDAVVLTDRENFIFLEEQFMERMGEEQIPVIDFWSVVKKV